MQPFTATPEQLAKLPEYNKQWIANALSCEPILPYHEEIRKNVLALYSIANLPAPKHIVFVPSPFVLAFAGGFAAAIWHIRKTGFLVAQATDQATRQATDQATRQATLSKMALFFLRCASNHSDMWDGGNHWSSWMCYLSSFQDVYSIEALREVQKTKFAPYRRLCEISGPRIMHPDFCMISDRPEILKVDEQNRPHSENGPYCRWRDGWSLYYVHGVRVPEYVIEHPEEINVEKIEKEGNAEIRRVMVDRYLGGMAKYILDSKAEIVNQDEFGTLYRKQQKEDEDIWMVHVVCPSTKREYFLGVDPNAYGGLKTARAAVASTWRKPNGDLVFASPDDYQPSLQT